MASMTEQEYLTQLYHIQSHNPPSIALLPSAEQIYDIDIATRTINSPKFLSVAHDHKSETIYFRVDRFNDYMDLSNTICIVQYVDALGKAHIYPVPFFDIVSEHKAGKMLLPWCIDGAATQTAGIVEYSFRFYRIDSINNELIFTYSLNTLPAKSNVLYGMDVQNFAGSVITASEYEYLWQEIQKINARDGVYWDIYE